MTSFFKIEGEISPKTSIMISIIGFIFLITVWQLFTVLGNVSPTILPSPHKVLISFNNLLGNESLLSNMWFSIKLNLYGYLEAILIAIPLGFLMGLIPFFRSLISKYFDAFRFLPIPAISGVFVAWFGIELSMKIHFLSFGIILYLVPVIVQRIDEIEKIHKQTIITLGANAWHKIIHLYFPYAISKISDDIRVLVAMSWTYIVIVELLNKEGGLGAMIFVASKQSRTDHIFALILVIIMIGYVQDILFRSLDKFLFPFKYDGQEKYSLTKRLKLLIVKRK